VDTWSRATGEPRGALVTPERVWALAQRWYDDRLRLDWRRRSVPERQAILEDSGLTGSFWRLT
jgi:hypothetical protein